MRGSFRKSRENCCMDIRQHLNAKDDLMFVECILPCINYNCETVLICKQEDILLSLDNQMTVCDTGTVRTDCYLRYYRSSTGVHRHARQTSHILTSERKISTSIASPREVQMYHSTVTSVLEHFNPSFAPSSTGPSFMERTLVVVAGDNPSKI